MSDIAVAQLQALGFSEYEARAYVALLQRGALTGYQLARESGIPRPNIYAVLERLQRRGAVVSVQVEEGIRYAALPAEEMLAQLSRSLEAGLADARQALGQLAQAPAPERAWNLQGYQPLISRAEALIDSAQSRLAVGIWSEEARRLADALARAQGRGIEPTVLCIQGCPQECGGCRGRIYRYPLAAGARSRWLVLVADSRELLVGQVSPDGVASGVVTTLEALVAVAGIYLHNAIAAAEIVRSLGPGLLRLLDARALEALQGAGLATDGASWWDRIFEAVRGSGG